MCGFNVNFYYIKISMQPNKHLHVAIISSMSEKTVFIFLSFFRFLKTHNNNVYYSGTIIKFGCHLEMWRNANAYSSLNYILYVTSSRNRLQLLQSSLNILFCFLSFSSFFLSLSLLRNTAMVERT